jgi:hypothetical protein
MVAKLNSYFTSHNRGASSEQDLYESLIIENIQWSGQEYIYIPRELSDRLDTIFGEDVLSSFSSSAPIEMWIENYSGYGGESEMLSKFGMEIRDTATFIVSRQKFVEEVVPVVPSSRVEAVKQHPNEGDLIYVPYSQSLFEIKFVEDEYPGFYQLKKKYVWALRCELVQLNNEKFSTGNSEIDSMFNVNLNRLTYQILKEDGGRILTETGGSTLTEEYVVHKEYDDIRGYGDNDALKKEFTDIMDFTEDNPFGENF